MAETLGSLCDKLTIVKLKQYHTDNSEKLKSLNIQENQLKNEIDIFIYDAIQGKIPIEHMTFDSNKVYKSEGNETREFTGSIASIFSDLSNINCELWHEQEKVYEFEIIPYDKKDEVVKNLAVLNLERNKCIDEINKLLIQICQN